MSLYCQSKLCNVLFAREFQRRYGHEGISAFAVHPGVIDTEFARNSRLLKILSPTITRLIKVKKGCSFQTSDLNV